MSHLSVVFSPLLSHRTGPSSPRARGLRVVAACGAVAVLVSGVAACGHDDGVTTTVTSITSTTVAGKNRTVAPEADEAGKAPDFSGLAMDASTDPTSKAYLKALKKAGIKTDGLETSLVGMGYIHCQAKQGNRDSQQIEGVMYTTLVQMQQGLDKKKTKRAVHRAADKYLC